jgi:hypothetical protein
MPAPSLQASMPETPSEPYRIRPGEIIEFSIARDLGTRVALDDQFRFARILLSPGVEVTASFSEREFCRLNDPRGQVRGTVGFPVFSQGPTSYNTPEGIDRMDGRFREEANRQLAEYDRQLIDYREGRSGARPSYPDLEKIPYWKDDFRLHPASGLGGGGPIEPGSVMHLSNLELSQAPQARSGAGPGRFAALGGFLGRIPGIGTAIAATMAAASGASGKEIAEAAGRATPLVGAGMAAVEGQFAEAGARLVGDLTFGVGEQALKEALPNAGFEPGILTQQKRLRGQEAHDPVATSNPPVGANQAQLKQAEKFSKVGHGWRAPDSDPLKPGLGPKT